MVVSEGVTTYSFGSVGIFEHELYFLPGSLDPVSNNVSVAPMSDIYRNHFLRDFGCLSGVCNYQILNQEFFVKSHKFMPITSRKTNMTIENHHFK